MPRSEAQKRADKKYHAKTYKNLQVSVKISDYEAIDEYCKAKNISKANMIVNSVKYCMENGIEFEEKE
ncbi:MAG: hypothetical protein IJZ65_10970 [Ruminiclostridium sp.]|nr:hypothetical protein [Ruminiclostridium sp.]